MKLVVGLGNPGEKYFQTRHNIGFAVVDRLVEELNSSFHLNKKFSSEEAILAEIKTLVVKPQTFMNLSGEAVSRVMQETKIKPEEMLLVRDDIDMEVGKVRLKQESGSGGHKGVESIVSRVGNNFTQLKIGVGRPVDQREVEDYVLQKPLPEEAETLEKAIAEAVLEIKKWAASEN